MNGGVIFLAIRSSQLIGEKKEWYFSSSWRRKKRKEIFDQHKANAHHTFSPVIFCVLNLQSHPSLPASWCGPSAEGPPAAPCPRSTHWVWALEPCAGCCCTSQPCCDCRTVAVVQKVRANVKVMALQANCSRRCQTCRTCTYQSVEHLVEHGSQTPPVDGAVIGLLLQDLRSQVL